jgi:hypothetical protein
VLPCLQPQPAGLGARGLLLHVLGLRRRHASCCATLALALLHAPQQRMQLPSALAAPGGGPLLLLGARARE